MDRAALRRLRRFVAGLCLLGWPLAGPGCGSIERVPYPEVPPPPPRAVSPAPAPPASGVRTVAHAEPAVDHHPPAPAPVPHEVPITLDTVLRIAEQSNPRIGGAREKLNESQMRSEQDCKLWLPQIYAGMAYYRHEGGIQDFQGHLVHSSYGSIYPALQLCTEYDVREATYRQIDGERRNWQNRAELSQVSNEILLDAATTYIDLLAARRGETLTRELEKYEQKLLERSQRLAREDSSVDALVEALKSGLRQRDYQAAQLRAQGNTASAKLVYLLGLPPLTCLVPVDAVFVPFELIDASTPTAELVKIAGTQGPTVQELEALVGTIQSGIDQSYSARQLLPTVQLGVYEGLFGAGVGGSLSFDNRFDLALQMKWNLTQLFSAESQRRLARSSRDQAQWTLQEARGKLAAGVQEAQQSILSGRERISVSMEQVKHASDSYRLSNRRLEEGLKNTTPADVVMSIRALEQAHFNYLQAVREHNRGQVRLLLFLGGGPAHEKKAAPPATLPPPTPADKKSNVLPRPMPLPDR